MTMLFNFGKKAAPTTEYKIGEGTAVSFFFSQFFTLNCNFCYAYQSFQNKGTYVPEGISKAQYDKLKAEEAAKKAAKQKKFPLGKEAETLTEWMLKEKAKGNEGKDLLLKGHRMVKAKYDGWYTNESPV